MNKYDVIVIGAGLSGCVVAERFASIDKKVLIVEKRDHIGGNCYDYIDKETGIRISKYGPHFFHTNDEEVWNYINKFEEWIRYDLKAYAHVDNRIVPIPVNMETINILNNKSLESESETRDYLSSIQLPNFDPKNSEDIALSRVGRDLYKKMFLPYTQKQWNRHPTELEPSVLARIPIRYNMESRYFTDRYQAIPKNGYTSFFNKLIDHPNIEIKLNTTLELPINHYCVIYTGPIDQYFKSSGLPPLQYRSLKFEEERRFDCGFIQQSIMINHPSEEVPYTRVIEYKHLPYVENSKNSNSIIIREYPSEIGEPYYPIPSKENQELYEKYQQLAKESKSVHMIGRLANYKYFNMDQAIRNALDYFNTHFN